MTELIQALTRAANAVAVYYEKQANPLGGITDTPPALAGLLKVAAAVTDAIEPLPVKTRKPRTPKEDAPKAVPVEPVVDPTLDILGLRGGVVAETPAPIAELTEEESVAKARELGMALVKRFNKPTGKLGPKGEPIPEGYDVALRLLADDFHVARIGDLVHAQRLQFITRVKALIAAADKVAA